MPGPLALLSRMWTEASLSAVQKRDFGISYNDGDDTYDFSDGRNANQKNESAGPPISVGAIAGIVIGSVAFLTIAGSIIYFMHRRNQQLRALYAYGVKDALPQGASLEDGLGSPASPAGPPPPYQPPARPPAAALRRQQSARSPQQPHIYQFQSAQHAIDANREQTMDGSHVPGMEGPAATRYSIMKTPAWNPNLARCELEAGPSSETVRRQAA